MKRVADVVIAVSAFTILFPLIIAIALLILVMSGRPVIYTQDRVGRCNRVFRMYKFRTMQNDADRTASPVTHSSDPRITAAVKILRPTHLDELPQLWNVFKGDMSIVGPRPYPVEYARLKTIECPAFEKRHAVRPGITGLVQIIGRRRALRRRTTAYIDLYYVRRHTHRMDIWIILMTFGVVIGRRGV